MNNVKVVQLTKHLRKKLSTVNSSLGFVAGWTDDTSWTCVECATSSDEFLIGIEVIGHFFYLLGPPETDNELLDLCQQQLQDSFKGEDEYTLVLFVYKDSSATTIEAKLYSSYYCMLKDANLLNDDAKTTSALLFRAKGQVPLIFEGSIDIELQKENLQAAIERLKSIFLNETPVFCSDSSQTLLRSSSIDDELTGVTCKNFAHDVLGAELDRKTLRKFLDEKVPINFNILIQTTGKQALENNVNHSLVIHCQRRHFLCISTYLPLDVIVVVQETELLADVYHLFISAILLQLDKLTECLLTFSKDCQVPTPDIYHFFPYEWDFPFTIIYPMEANDEVLEKHRRNIHVKLLLPVDRPAVRKGNRHYFCNEGPPCPYLVNPHVGLLPHGVSSGKLSTVSGRYSYHHYRQDHMDDDGWGCAYRSLQTIVSWFKFQAYTDKNIPTHKEIQQALVDVGDKPSSFVGSKQWIGSQEVSFCLDHLIGVASKILFVNCGANLGTKGNELVKHFEEEGTPIMIGGGVLAHTILGVHYNSDTDEIQFLVLDPHYTGAEDLATVQSKGWCGWKALQFWDQTAFYNLCLPQRPLTI